MVGSTEQRAKRRGAGLQTANRFERIHLAPDEEILRGPSGAWGGSMPAPQPLPILSTEVFRDESRTVVTENRSPDIRFRYSLNPYRGCEHGCTYCYARPSHEMLGFSAGLDFETKILAKPNAPRLLRDFLRRPDYRPEPIVLSGVTDPYQPIERKLRLTRQCLEVLLECRHPVEILTKNRLILRDLDLLRELARQDLVMVSLAVTTLDENLQFEMEPRAATPIGRLEAMRELSGAGVPVRLLIAPVIPGLTDSEIPSIIKSARRCGARYAGYTLLRLPHSVKEIFIDWLQRTFPNRVSAILSRVRDLRGGALNDPRFGSRMRGTGPWADQIARVFQVFARMNELSLKTPTLNLSHFKPPADPSGQLTLF